MKLARAHRIVKAFENAGFEITTSQELQYPKGSYLIGVDDCVDLEVFHDVRLMKRQGRTPDCSLVLVDGSYLVPESQVVAFVKGKFKLKNDTEQIIEDALKDLEGRLRKGVRKLLKAA